MILLIQAASPEARRVRKKHVCYTLNGYTVSLHPTKANGIGSLDKGNYVVCFCILLFDDYKTKTTGILACGYILIK